LPRRKKWVEGKVRKEACLFFAIPWPNYKVQEGLVDMNQLNFNIAKDSETDLLFDGT